MFKKVNQNSYNGTAVTTLCHTILTLTKDWNNTTYLLQVGYRLYCKLQISHLLRAIKERT